MSNATVRCSYTHTHIYIISIKMWAGSQPVIYIYLYMKMQTTRTHTYIKMRAESLHIRAHTHIYAYIHICISRCEQRRCIICAHTHTCIAIMLQCHSTIIHLEIWVPCNGGPLGRAWYYHATKMRAQLAPHNATRDRQYWYKESTVCRISRLCDIMV